MNRNKLSLGVGVSREWSEFNGHAVRTIARTFYALFIFYKLSVNADQTFSILSNSYSLSRLPNVLTPLYIYIYIETSTQFSSADVHPTYLRRDKPRKC